MNILNYKNKIFWHVKTLHIENAEYTNRAPNGGIYLGPPKNCFIKVN